MEQIGTRERRECWECGERDEGRDVDDNHAAVLVIGTKPTHDKQAHSVGKSTV